MGSAARASRLCAALLLALLARPARATCWGPMCQLERVDGGPLASEARPAFALYCQTCCSPPGGPAHCSHEAQALDPAGPLGCLTVQGLRFDGGIEERRVGYHHLAGPAYTLDEELPPGEWTLGLTGPVLPVLVDPARPQPLPQLVLPGSAQAVALAEGERGAAVLWSGVSAEAPQPRIRLALLGPDLAVRAQVDLGDLDWGFGLPLELAVVPTGAGWLVAGGSKLLALDAAGKRLGPPRTLPGWALGLVERPGGAVLLWRREQSVLATPVLPDGRDEHPPVELGPVGDRPPAGLWLGSGALVAAPLTGGRTRISRLERDGRLGAQRELPLGLLALVADGDGALLLDGARAIRLDAAGVPRGHPFPQAEPAQSALVRAGDQLVALGPDPFYGPAAVAAHRVDALGRTQVELVARPKDSAAPFALAPGASGRGPLAAWRESDGTHLARLAPPPPHGEASQPAVATHAEAEAPGCPSPAPAPDAFARARLCGPPPGPPAPPTLSSPPPPACPTGPARCVLSPVAVAAPLSLALAGRGERLATAWVSAPAADGRTGVHVSRLGPELKPVEDRCLGQPDARAVALAATARGYLLAVERWQGVELLRLDEAGQSLGPAWSAPGAADPALFERAGGGALLVWSPSPGAREARMLDEAGQRLGRPLGLGAGPTGPVVLTRADGFWLFTSEGRLLRLDLQGRLRGESRFPGAGLRVRSAWATGPGAEVLLEEPKARAGTPRLFRQRLDARGAPQGEAWPLGRGMAALPEAGYEAFLDAPGPLPALPLGSDTLLALPWALLRLSPSGAEQLGLYAVAPREVRLAPWGTGLAMGTIGPYPVLAFSRLEPAAQAAPRPPACWLEQPCPKGLRCRAPEPVAACAQDAECGEGRACAQVQGTRACVPLPCGAGASCPGPNLRCERGACLPRPCRSSRDCRAPARCVPGPDGARSCLAEPGACEAR